MVILLLYHRTAWASDAGRVSDRCFDGYPDGRNRSAHPWSAATPALVVSKNGQERKNWLRSRRLLPSIYLAPPAKEWVDIHREASNDMLFGDHEGMFSIRERQVPKSSDRSSCNFLPTHRRNLLIDTLCIV